MKARNRRMLWQWVKRTSKWGLQVTMRRMAMPNNKLLSLPEAFRDVRK